MGIIKSFKNLFSNKTELRPIEEMTDDEVHNELIKTAKKQGQLEFIKGMLNSGGGERQLLRMLRTQDRIA